MTQASTKISCHHCGYPIEPSQVLCPPLNQVSSDCRPWLHPLRLAVCNACSVIQKCTDPKSLKTIFNVYIDYDIYAQSNGSDQISFDSKGIAKPTRSQTIVNLLSSLNFLESTGKIMDFGCGNGNFLEAFGNHFHSWQLLGVEQNIKYQKNIESLKNAKFTSKPLKQIKGEFDLISLVHVLEHIVNPIKFLKNISKKLTSNGLILIEVPNLKKSPFDILIADHVTHFYEETIRQSLQAANLEILFLSDTVIDKELTILAKPKINQKKFKGSFQKSLSLLSSQINYATELLDLIKQSKNELGIFGSSIAASWLTGEIGDKASFFIDEDPLKIGNIHLGRPIISLKNVPHGTTIALPFRADVAKLITHKFNPEHQYKFIFVEQ